MAAKVSVIIPIYNTEKYLVRCMDSVLGQTLKDIEIILVDDQSPDNAPAQCDKYVKMDSRVRVIHKKNGGLGLARNSGLEIATGEYVAFLDSDDYVDKRMYELLYRVAVEHNCQMVMSGYNFVDRHGKVRDCTNTMAKGLYEGKRVKDLLFATLEQVLLIGQIISWGCRCGEAFIPWRQFVSIISVFIRKENLSARMQFSTLTFSIISNERLLLRNHCISIVITLVLYQEYFEKIVLRRIRCFIKKSLKCWRIMAV